MWGVRGSAWVVCLVVFFTLTAPLPAQAELGDLARVIVNPDRLPAYDFEAFGATMAGIGSSIAVTGPGAAYVPGRVYLLDPASGHLVRRFEDPGSDSFFGGDLAEQNGTLLVGGTNSVYACDPTDGSIVRTYLDPNAPSLGGPHRDGGLGATANFVAVGNPTVTSDSGGQGTVNVFSSATHELLYTLSNPHPEREYEDFGWSVSCNGSQILVGACGYGDPVGSAYLFDAPTGNLIHELPNPNASRGDRYGWEVALSDAGAIVSASCEDHGATNSGSAYVWDTQTGELLHTIDNPHPDRYDVFGLELAAAGGYALVGSPYDDSACRAAGAAFLVDMRTGEIMHDFLNPHPEYGLGGTRFADGLALADSLIAVGEAAPTYNGYGGAEVGQVYVFVPEPATCCMLLLGLPSLLCRRCRY